MLHPENPYSLLPAKNPRLLRTRRGQIRLLLDSVAPAVGGASHALVCGPPRSGRSSILEEAARRAREERDCLVVTIRLFEEDLTHSGLTRTVLGAVVEQIASLHDTEPDWYRAWCNRVLLRDTSPMSINDMFVSSLAFAAEPLATIDPAVLDRDLRTLARLARDAGRNRVLVVFDDADALLEDSLLVDRLFASFGTAEGFALIMAARFSGLGHLADAVSPSLRTCTVVGVPPFWSPGAINACLSGPLDSGEEDQLIPRENRMRLLADVLQLSGGSPFDIAVIGAQMWEACRAGEQEHYELTPRIFERVLPMLTMYTGGRDDLAEAVEAVRGLPADRLECALRLVALSELNVGQIAVARAIGLPHTDGTALGQRLGSCDLDKERARTIAELEQLENDGVVSLSEDGESFKVRGGRLAALTLKCQARTLLGSKTADQPFEMPFLATVGEPIARECLAVVRARVTGAETLAFQPLYNTAGSAAGTRLHAALNRQRFDHADLDLFPTVDEADQRLAPCLIAPDERVIVVVELTLVAGGDDVACVEMWEAPVGTTTNDVNEAVSSVLDEWKPLIEKAGVTWRSSQAVALTGSAARVAVTQLVPMSAATAITRLFEAWRSGESPDGLERCLDVATDAVAALRDLRGSDSGRGFEYRDLLSRRGFLLSLGDTRLDDAVTDLERARERGPGDGWVTDWNLANLALRTGNVERALGYLADVHEQATNENSGAIVVFHVPGRAVHDSIAMIGRAGVHQLLPLQCTIAERLLADGPEEPLLAALAVCVDSDDEAVRTVAQWVDEAIQLGAFSSPTTQAG